MNETAATPLSLSETLEQISAGAQIVDVRPVVDFEAGHLVGSIFLGLGGKLEGWAGIVLDPDRPVILVAAPGDEPVAMQRLADGGITNIAGTLTGGIAALDDEWELKGRIPRTDAATLAAELESGHPPAVLDVREDHEYAEDHVENAINIPLSELQERLGDVPRNENIVIHCLSGYRSAIAASLLAKSGFRRIRDLGGGWKAWCARG